MSIKQQIHQSIASERRVTGGREIELTFRIGASDAIPSILMIPDASNTEGGTLPVALLLHGYSSRKEVMAHSIGRSLFGCGIASLSIDLPLHGTRADPAQAQASRNPLAMMKIWKLAMEEARMALAYLRARKEIDRERLAMIGYSMGSYLSVATAAEQQSVQAVVVAAGGDLPDGTPFAAMARMVVDPVRAVSKLNGRPLLMIHGRSDRTVTPAQAQRLFDAAHEPKELIWYDAGHYLPAAASAAAAKWLKDRLRA